MSENTENGNARPKRKRNGIIILVVFAVAMIFLNRQEPVSTVDCTPEIIAKKPDVIMLGAWWCTYCYQAKKYFQKNKISYCEYDMENTEQGQLLYKKHGGGAVPIILIGEYTLKGYSEQQIDAALATLKKPTNIMQ